MKILFLQTFWLSFFFASQMHAVEQPNIVIIYVDDLGYGDVGCYNPESEIPTPNLDKLAAEGMRFTDAHSASTVCTPSRYSLLTGRMQFRNGYKGVCFTPEGPSLIEEDRLTLPQMLRDEGYATAAIGKWHLGLTFFNEEGNPVEEERLEGVKTIDFSHPIPDGPVDRGFDYFFGTSGCPTTDYLYAYIENDRVVKEPTGFFNLAQSDLVKTPFTRDGRLGMIAEGFDMEMVDLVFLEKSIDFMENQVEQHPKQPFFLYLATQAVHLPSLPADQFKGKTSLGAHADFIFQMDFMVGEILNTLERLGIADDTLVIFGSDNGPEASTSTFMRELHGHDPARPWRGLKRDQWEGGHRTPFIVCWPGKIPAGSVSDQLISQTDVMATCASIIGATLPNDAGEDSYDMLPVLLGNQGNAPVRTYMLQQTHKHEMSIRQGNWKYLDHQGSGGNDYTAKEYLRPYIQEDTDPDAPGQLYNLTSDPGERRNLYSKYPELVEHLRSQLEHFKSSGRSAP